jgi:hypothetical protein
MCEDALPRSASNIFTFSIRKMKQDVCDIVLIPGKQNLLSRREKFSETFPVIGDDRRSAC